jgi:predicted MPP superfamily phosphohydrolase
MISRRQFLKVAAGTGLVGVAPAAYGAGIEAWDLRVTRYNVQPPQWPSGFQLKIAALADLHACEPWMDLDRIAGIVARTNALQPDLIVLLGDYVAGMPRATTGYIPAAKWAPVLGGLKAPLGVHAVLGNHDWWEDRTVMRSGQGKPIAQREMEAAGIPVYENDAVRMTKEGHPFWLAGLGDQLAYMAARRYRTLKRIGVDDLGATLAKITDDAPVVMMAHEPDVATRMPSRVALQLSGHTHGGQMRLFGWSPIVPSRYGGRFAYGHMRENCDIVVSGGLGCTALPIRINMPPEIVLVTLGGVGNA